MGDAFRHAGQNPSEDVIKDMVEKARAMKKPMAGELIDEGKCRRETSTIRAGLIFRNE